MIHNSHTSQSHFCLQVICIFKTVVHIFTAPLHFLTYFWQTKLKSVWPSYFQAQSQHYTGLKGTFSNTICRCSWSLQRMNQSKPIAKCWISVCLCSYHSYLHQVRTCHFFTSDLNLSVVMFMPWKLVRQFLPWTSSQINLNFLKATSSFCRSARDTSNTRPFRPSDAISVKKMHAIWTLLVPTLIDINSFYKIPQTA